MDVIFSNLKVIFKRKKKTLKLTGTFNQKYKVKYFEFYKNCDILKEKTKWDNFKVLTWILKKIYGQCISKLQT